MLTNAVTWRVYKVTFGKPIDQDLVIEIDFCSLVPRQAKDVESLYLFCKEGWMKSVLGDYHIQKLALSRFSLAALVLSDSVLDVIRRELRRVSPDVRVDNEEIRAVLTSEVIKREVMEGDKADGARRKITRVANKAQRSKSKESTAIDSITESDSSAGNGTADGADPAS